MLGSIRPGMHKYDVDTPALLIDIDKLDRNIRHMQEFVTSVGCSIRPHFKAHRTPAITRRQLDAGGIGVTCAKLGEAELLVEEGFDNILIANEVMGDIKHRRLAEVNRRAVVMCAVDSAAGVQRLGRIATDAGAVVGVLVDVNVGMNRCGVDPGTPAVDLARLVVETPGVELRGMMAYEGQVVQLPRGEEKERCTRAAVGLLLEAAAAVRDAGMPVGIVSCGGTGSYHITATCEGVTELQAGTYTMNDILFHTAGADFEFAVTVLATIISRPAPTRTIADAGRKSIHPQFANSLVTGTPGLVLDAIHSEHGLLTVDPDRCTLDPGDKFEVIPHYAEGTVNLHREFVVVQNDHVVDVWPISGGGHST